MGDFFPVVGVLASLGALAGVLIGRAPKEQRTVLAVSLVSHVVACLLRLWYATTYFGGSDADGFAMHAMPLVEFVSSDPLRWLDDVVYFTLGLRHQLPLALGPQTSTGSMIGIATLGLFLTSGSLAAVHVGLTILGFFSKWVLYLGLSEVLPEPTHPQLLRASVLLPSVVFWTTGLVKETLALTGIALFVFGLTRWHSRGFRSLDGAKHLPFAIAGIGIVALFKPFFLFPLAGATAGYLALSGEREGRFRMTPARWIAATAMGIGLIVAVSELFPRFSPSQIADTAATMQRLGATQMESAGSQFVLGAGAGDRSARAQLLLAPLGILTALTRPFVFESRSVAMLICSVEMTVLTVMLVRVLFRMGPGGFRKFLASHPMILFCAIFVVTSAAGVGIATSNFGTLSRYRVPFMPFYGTILMMAYATLAAKRPVRRVPIAPVPIAARRR